MGWGDCDWGSFFWGADFCSVDGLGSVADTKPDTVFYGTDGSGTPANIAVDLSQHAVNFTAGATFIHSANAEARLTPRNRFSMETRIDVTTGVTSGTIMSIRDEVGGTQLLRVTRFGASLIRLIVNGASIAAITLAGLAASTRKILIMVSATPNPRTTGASDAVCYEMTIFEQATGDEHHVAMFAPEFTVTADYRMIWNAQDSAGTDAYALGFTRARYGRAYHSPTEMWEDWVLKTTPGASQVRKGFPPALPDRNQIAIADEGDFSGPAYLSASSLTRDLSFYTVGPAVQFMANVPRPWKAVDMDDTGIWQDTFGTTTLYSSAYVWSAIPPPHVNRWRVVMNVRLTGVVGAGTRAVITEVTAVGRWLNGKDGTGSIERVTSDILRIVVTTVSSTTTREAKQWYSIPASKDGRVYFMLGAVLQEFNADDTWELVDMTIEWARAEAATQFGVGGG